MTETLRQGSERMGRQADKISLFRGDDRMIGIEAHTAALLLVERAKPARNLPMVEIPAKDGWSFRKVFVDSDGHTQATQIVERVEIVRRSDLEDHPFGRIHTTEEISVDSRPTNKPPGSVEISYGAYDQQGNQTASRGLTYTASNNGVAPVLQIHSSGEVLEGWDRMEVISQLNSDLGRFEDDCQALINAAQQGVRMAPTT